MKIISDSVKNAVVSELINIAPDVVVYKEAVTNPSYPHFFVYQVSLDNEEERKGVFILNYLINIRYRVVSDPSTDLKIQNKLDAMSIKFLQYFDIIKLDNGFIKCLNKSCEKVDGVLQFTFNVRIPCRKEEEEEGIKQGKLKISVNA